VTSPAAVAPETIPRTRVTTTEQFFGPFGPYASDIGTAEVTVDRTVSNGLNSLTAADQVTVGVQYSIDGAPWFEVVSCTWGGGTITSTHGGTTITRTSEGPLGFGIPGGFPANRTQFRIRAVSTSSVFIAGSITYA
jgi:hypothetical protein